MAMLHFYSPGQSMQMEVWQVNIAALTQQVIATRLLAVKAPGVLVRRAQQALLSQAVLLWTMYSPMHIIVPLLYQITQLLYRFRDTDRLNPGKASIAYRIDAHSIST
jgi:hypothetical protein